ncbi:Lar family restriction alleviation protein [Pseudomonas aeruginosa]|uniref:Lar family restriction alleviation protein n=1 Tax=Pseudomonas aeruginosa TaxID=287 RepID=UPI001A231C2F|nr:Lar family restriction alleviation protein [Pseudomonas aeruginosa]MBI7127702.1 Lar family restriction alleviation protein [Pseudomonas aeruginosa]MBU5919247.1 Lar family restriction alleviation protein [Pseudomonas aeruginosa]MBU5950208.1 Lar family restriction alleviation protein [Pseudomonas aeruginosa]MCJ2343380.1 Lar family restriction alleviation protein [Pseudomonas aeruginosa]MCJ2362756.1 Lar family restriction alleviation protein [Pseudomonas aeruginosa]
MAEELKPCPCCGGEAVFVELDDGGMVAVCASRGCVASGVARYACGDEPRPLIAETWNARAAPAGHVVVSEGLLRRIVTAALTSSDAQDRIGALEELRALLSEQA